MTLGTEEAPWDCLGMTKIKSHWVWVKERLSEAKRRGWGCRWQLGESALHGAGESFPKGLFSLLWDPFVSVFTPCHLGSYFPAWKHAWKRWPEPGLTVSVDMVINLFPSFLYPSSQHSLCYPGPLYNPVEAGWREERDSQGGRGESKPWGEWEGL